MRTAIATDSNSGITQEQAEKLGIYVLPMPFMINGEMFYEGVNLTHEEFFTDGRRSRYHHIPAITRRSN